MCLASQNKNQASKTSKGSTCNLTWRGLRATLREGVYTQPCMKGSTCNLARRVYAEPCTKGSMCNLAWRGLHATLREGFYMQPCTKGSTCNLVQRVLRATIECYWLSPYYPILNAKLQPITALLIRPTYHKMPRSCSQILRAPQLNE